MYTADLEHLESQVINALSTAADVSGLKPEPDQQDVMDDAAHDLMDMLPRILRLEKASPLVGAICDMALDVTAFDPAEDAAVRAVRRDDAISGSARLMILTVVESAKLAPEQAVASISGAADIVLKRPAIAAA